MAATPFCRAAPIRRAATRSARTRRPALAALSALMTLLFFTCPAAARTWIVRPGGSIQAAIDRAGDGDVILILPGEYREGLVIEGKRLTLMGLGAHLTTVRLVPEDSTADTLTGLAVRGTNAAGTRLIGLGLTGDPHDPVTIGLNLGTDVALLGCRLVRIGTTPTSSYDVAALVVSNDADVDLTACSFEGCWVALRNEGGSVVALGCAFAQCIQGITKPFSCVPESTMLVRGSTFTGCDYAIRDGGEQLVAEDCLFENCRHGVEVRCSEAIIRRCDFVRHAVDPERDGPAVDSGPPPGRSTLLEDCVFAGAGPRTAWTSLIHGTGVLRVDGCTFDNNGRGCVFQANGLLDVVDCSFTGNTGPAIEMAYSAGGSIVDCRFENNPGPRGLVLPYITAGDLEFQMRGCAFRNNVATVGPLVAGVDDIVDCTFLENNTTNSGGLIALADTIYRCRVERNAGGGLGGDHVDTCDIFGNTGTLLAGAYVNCALVGNDVSAARCRFTGCSIISNPGVRALSSATGCIVRDGDGATAPRRCTYSNLDGHFAPDLGNINADPLFVRDPSPGPDQTWGTPDDDYGDLRLQPGSPCIDAADSTAFDDDIATDLGGAPRFVDDPATPDTGLPDPARQRAVADMGAYEFQPASGPPAPVCDVDLDGAVDVRDLLRFLHRWTSGDAAADLDGNGDVDVIDLLEFLDCFTTAR